MANFKLQSKFFCGNQISEYGLKNRRLDYGTLAKAFDAVLCNSIVDTFYQEINGEYNEPEQENGFIDNSEEIDELTEERNALEDKYFETDDESEKEYIGEQIDRLNGEIEDLEREQDEQQEIFQYFIVSSNGADLIKEFTNDPLFYLPALDLYVWGVTHFGTAWDYVLTDTEIEIDG